MNSNSKPVSPTIQESERISENNSPDTIEMLYIESSNIGLTEFRKRINDYTTQQVLSAQLDILIWATGGIREFTEEGAEVIQSRISQLQSELNTLRSK